MAIFQRIVPEKRRFNGKVFTFDLGADHRSSLEKRAGKLRKEGYLCRIVKEKGIGYFLYKRKK